MAQWAGQRVLSVSGGWSIGKGEARESLAGGSTARAGDSSGVTFLPPGIYLVANLGASVIVR